MMVSIEHGHEKKHGGHESPGGKHGKWKEHALTALKAAGIFAFAKGYEPTEVGDFHKLGNDFYITV